MIRVNDWIVEQNHFPDGTLRLNLSDSSAISTDWIKIKWNYENDAELFTLICIRKHFHNHKAILIMPYIPHARMDRVQEKTDVFTLKYFCEVINSLDFYQVIVTDPHSNVSTALLNNVIIDNADDIIEATIEHFAREKDGNIALFYPDEGAMKRYSKMSFGYNFGFGMKKRDWSTGKILDLDILQKENIIGKDILIVDDICSRGGTFYHSAKALLNAGAKSVSLYITHCENTILDGEIFTSGLIEKVYTTSSLVHSEEVKKHVTYAENLEEY